MECRRSHYCFYYSCVYPRFKGHFLIKSPVNLFGSAIDFFNIKTTKLGRAILTEGSERMSNDKNI